jgi:hypothetical protein
VFQMETKAVTDAKSAKTISGDKETFSSGVPCSVNSWLISLFGGNNNIPAAGSVSNGVKSQGRFRVLFRPGSKSLLQVLLYEIPHGCHWAGFTLNHTSTILAAIKYLSSDCIVI